MTTPRHRSYQRRNLNRLVTIPERCHPHVKLIFAEMRRQRVRYDDLEEMSGVRRASMKAWRRKNKPSLESLECVLNSLGYQYVPVPNADKLSPPLAAEINSLCERFQVELPEVFAALCEVGAYQQALAQHGTKAAWQPNLAA